MQYVQANIADHDDRLRIVEEAVKAFGRIDVLVNNAGVAPKERADLLTMTEESFDRVILGYNELQKKQGLDLSKYENKRVTRYTYRVTNYKSDGEVYANLFVYRSKIVACDLSSGDPLGFVIPLTLVDRGNLK